MSILEIVRKNEKKEAFNQTAVEEAFIFFGENSQFTIPHEDRKMLKLQPFKRLSEVVYLSDQGFYGQPSVIKLYMNRLFIGCSLGIVRIFDIAAGVEHNPLMPKKKKNFAHRVTCIDISLTGERLAVGYTSGKICVFDLVKSKPLIEIDDVCKTEVIFVKFLSDTSSQCLITADKRGFVTKMTISKGLLKHNCKSIRVVSRPVVGLSSIAALKPKEGMPYEVLEMSYLNITAIASTNMLAIYYLYDRVTQFYSISREDFSRSFIREGSLCHLDWGYGITPTISRVNSKCLLAIGWDKVLQIAILGNPQQANNMIIFDGYYICDYPIDRVQFISDSVIMILVNKKEVRLLFIPDFLPGSFSKEGLMMKEAEDSKMTIVGPNCDTFQSSLGEDFLRDLSLKAEVDKGVTLLKGDIRYSETAEKHNFSHSIVTYGNKIMVLGQNELLLARLYHWEAYLEYLQKKLGWLVCLKAAIDIYSGDIKGYYGVPYISEDREDALVGRLKELLLIGVSSMVKDINNKNQQIEADNDPESEPKEDINPVKVSIEFCHEINSFDFLFTRIFAEFQDEGFENRFVLNLEPFILNGFFRDVLVPDPVLRKICDYYFEQQKYLVLEKITSCLDFTEYEYIDDLIIVCTLKRLTTALIHLAISSNQAGEDSCSKILKKIFECFKSIPNQIDLQDIKEWYRKSKSEKYALTSSYQYIGLKLMNIILLFLRGERYPEGRLGKAQHHLYLTQTIEFVFENEKTFDLLEVDARSFFRVISEIYMNKSLCNFLKDLNDDGIFNITHEIILEKFKESVNSYEGVKHLKFEFSYWIIKIANCEMYKSEPQKISEIVNGSIIFVLDEVYKFVEKRTSPEFKLKLEDKFSGPNGVLLHDMEQEILDILPYYCEFMKDEEKQQMIDISQKLEIDRIRVYLYESQKDFEQCIQIFLTSPGCDTDDIFKWLRGLYKRKESLGQESVEKIRSEITKAVRELIIANSVKTSKVIEEWLSDKHIEIINSISENQELQLQYLSDFIHQREDEISEVMKSAVIVQNPRLNEYKHFIKLRIKLLVKLTNKRIEIKDYYPIDCLDDIEGDNVKIREARAYLYKRNGEIDNSVSIFLGLLEEISYDEIKQDAKKTKLKKDRFFLSFDQIYHEICQLLVRWTSAPGYKDKIWSQVLRTLFKIKRKYYVDINTKKTRVVNKVIFAKISDFLQLMSKYNDFKSVITLLLEIDSRATFRYSKQWFESLFISKENQEFLYKSAKKLLRNESSAMIDNIVDQHQHGYKGGDGQTCDLCKKILMDPFFERSLLFCMCRHNFHMKCYTEETKMLEATRLRPEAGASFQCPLCWHQDVSVEDKQRKRANRVNRRRKKKEDKEEVKSDVEKSPVKRVSTTSKAPEDPPSVTYLRRMKAFDDDFSASVPQIIFP